MRKKLSLLACMVVSPMVVATDVSLLDPGDVIYQTGLTGVLSPEKVEVVRIDSEGDRVKVRNLEDGLSEWVDSGKLYTADELRSARWGTGIKVFVAAADGYTKAQKDSVGESCTRESEVQSLLGVAQAARPGSGISLGTLCACLADRIVAGATQDTVDRIAADFLAIRELGEETFLGYVKGCTPPVEQVASEDASDPVIDLESGSRVFVPPASADSLQSIASGNPINSINWAQMLEESTVRGEAAAAPVVSTAPETDPSAAVRAGKGSFDPAAFFWFLFYVGLFNFWLFGRSKGG